MTPPLDDAEAFAALTRVLSGQDAGYGWSASSPAVERLRQALAADSASALDLAVLLRQALAWETTRRGSELPAMVSVSHPRLATFDGWNAVGLPATTTPEGTILSYQPWRPQWLDCGDAGVDGFAASETTLRSFNSDLCTRDPMLQAVERSTYRSPGQRAAVRAALSTPPGGSLVVALPTGEGKSLIFQLIHKVGFAGPRPASSHGVTLVIVPTVALAINHEKEAVNICALRPPLAFQGGNDDDNQVIAENIANGTQGLCFASPEAACGRLRGPLRHAAAAGHLRAIVIDEAHLVDQWGTGFRTEFQELSALRRELMAAASAAAAPRTIMLSATLTDTSEMTLKRLFADEGRFASISAIQLRPEPDYWVGPVVAEAARTARVLEAVHHLPRPMVLYVTEVKAAREWLDRLREAGFARVQALHGATKSAERAAIVDRWRHGDLDVVVGTSAFGLGIDYAHARSILHACMPETLDRFYQEVGRGGRDGRASLSLILPTPRDIDVARKLNAITVITAGRGLQRWQAMFDGKRMCGPGRIAVRVDGRPGGGEEDIDMSGDLNTDWNLRTLMVTARAGMIRLLGAPDSHIEEPGDWLELEILDDHHLDVDCWNARFEPVRGEIATAAKRNLELMQRFLEDRRCPAEVFEELYGAHRVAHRCSRCRACRADRRHKRRAKQVGEPRSPWLLPRGPLMSSLLGESNTVLVNYEPEDLVGRRMRRLSTAIDRLERDGLAKLLVLGTLPPLERLLDFAQTRPLFVANLPNLAHSRLPKGPELVIVGDGGQLASQNLRPGPENPRLFLAPKFYETEDGRVLRDVFEGRRLNLDEFVARVSQ
ncbi:protein DpdF [Thalassobaculum sp.]|uniref:protein DpdF n=1 Tax=Thalassobaculum sp. TaxID=2022740 RepID=UPI003B5A6996